MQLIEGHRWSYAFTETPADRPSIVRDDVAEASDKVRFVASYTGDFTVFTAVTHDSLEELREIMDALWPPGLRTFTVTLERAGTLGVPKRHSPDQNVIVLAQARGDRFAVLAAVDAVFAERYADDEPDHERFNVGTATVKGGGHGNLLFDLGNESYDDLVDMYDELVAVDGVKVRFAGWADLRNNAKRPNPFP
jgi:hypothetical protein